MEIILFIEEEKEEYRYCVDCNEETIFPLNLSLDSSEEFVCDSCILNSHHQVLYCFASIKLPPPFIFKKNEKKEAYPYYKAPALTLKARRTCTLHCIMKKKY